MASCYDTVVIRIRWWFPLYISLLILFCKTFRTMPDFDKVNRVLDRGIVVRKP